MSHDDLHVLAGDPIQKWGDVILHASSKRTREELERLLEAQALCEILLEDLGLQDKFSALLKQQHVDGALQERVQAKKMDLAIQSMALVLSGHE
ncbi:hypothetical protein NHP200010_06030 [Helicobacter bizzozeronii]|uniref:DUF2018 family protein n=1 Tax=Helicobacter bizzozeronii TaxID=56877 RepID=UPI00244D9837|nr:DUF2018 family protein [Helicobacter bizzozeronii]GMB92892.1 hypothetical protein NHP200010_06030 [Helicobacter bizzozeronii]